MPTVNGRYVPEWHASFTSNPDPTPEPEPVADEPEEEAEPKAKPRKRATRKRASKTVETAMVDEGGETR